MVSLAASEKGFVNFYNLPLPAKRFGVQFFHRLADTMAEIPSGLVGHADVPGDLERGDAFVGFTHQGHRHEPLLQRQVCRRASENAVSWSNAGFKVNSQHHRRSAAEAYHERTCRRSCFVYDAAMRANPSSAS